MAKRFHILVFIGLAVLSRSCIEPFTPEIPDYENILVVDGMITDELKPNLVKISRSFSYGEYNPEPEMGALVSVMDDAGGNFYLEELEPGHYYTDEDEFAGEPGRAYQLHFTLSDGKEYVSDYVILKKAPPVESLEAYYTQKETADPDHFIDGVQVYLNTSDPQNQTRYYRWEWEETWEYTVPMRIPDANIYRCWRSDLSRTILVANTGQLTSDRIIDFPVHFISAESNRLRILYSILVKQYALSQPAYDFWKMHEDQGENAGTLFDPIPTEIPGNIYNPDDPEEPVLGFFEASGTSSMRIFISPDLLPADVVIPTDFEYCRFQVMANPSEADLNYLLANGWIYIDDYYDRDDLIVRLTNHITCLDCTQTGTNVRPDYWPDGQKPSQSEK
jgi:hypothetical protein